MNFSVTKIKGFCFITILLGGMLNMKAQEIKADSIFWNNGNVSLLNDLDRVWIILKKGKDIKDARIVEIKKEKGTLVYEKEKCLHDIAINNIERIQAGKNSLSSMNFRADNTLYITKDYLYPDPLLDYSDFRSLKITNKLTPKIEPIIAAPTNEELICDTLIEENGHFNLVKIVSVDSKFLYYRQIRNPSGPIYVKCSDHSSVTRYSKCTTVNFFKNH
jgi:hypothetical protein